MHESVGLATGFLIQALHRAGLATLTHTPEPMSFLTDICGRDKNNERPYMLLITDYPDEHATVPLHAPDKSRLMKLRVLFNRFDLVCNQQQVHHPLLGLLLRVAGYL